LANSVSEHRQCCLRADASDARGATRAAPLQCELHHLIGRAVLRRARQIAVGQVDIDARRVVLELDDRHAATGCTVLH
jgi:hypothetical protein